MHKIKSSSPNASKLDGAMSVARLKGNLFSVVPDIDTETLLANAAETLSAVNDMASKLAFELEGSQRGLVLGIQQMVEQSLLLVDRALEQVAPV